MQFKTLKAFNKAASVLRKERGEGRAHYPPMFKRAICEALEADIIKRDHVSNTLECSPSSIPNWMAQYEAGLYTEEGAYAVSHRSLGINSKIIKSLEKEIATLQKRLALVKECEEEGVKVA